MAITGIEGDIGDGKTLVLTKFGVDEHRLGKPIYSNYHLKGGLPYTYITLEDALEWAEEEHDLRNACILISEAQIWFDARLSASKSNRLFSYFLLQTGKADINLYYDTQEFFQVDNRLRRRTKYAIHVQKRAGDLHLLTIKNTRKPNTKPKRAVVYGPDYWQFYDTKETVRLTRKVA